MFQQVYFIIFLTGTSKHHIPIDGCINQSKLTSLQFLTFGTFLGQPGIDHLSGIWDTLQTIPTENCIRNVILLICDINFLNTVRTGPQGCFNANWEAFDRQISRLSNGKPLNLILRMYYRISSRRKEDRSSADSNQASRACEAALERLVKEKLKLVKNSPHIKITLDSMDDFP